MPCVHGARYQASSLLDAILVATPAAAQAVVHSGKNDMNRPRQRLVPVLAVAATALAAATLAAASSSSRYEGKVKGAGPVSFRLSGDSVQRFRASVSVTCASSSGGTHESYLVAPDRSARRDEHGRFTLEFKKAKQVGGPFPLYKIDASVHGNVNARSSSGTVRVTYYKNQLVSGRLILTACGSGKANWTAKPK